MKKILLAAGFFLFLSAGLLTFKVSAAQLDITVESSDGSDGEALLDDVFNTTEPFEANTSITLRAGEPIDSIYIKWDSVPGEWTLRDGSTEKLCGTNGFLHEFVKLSGTSTEATITLTGGEATIADVFAFSAGELPSFVQQWNPPWDKADMLFISTHSDDEVLFFGGVIPNYTNGNRARVQVAYFSDFFLTESYRNHELLDGIWEMGVDHYPQLGRFYDNYSETLEEAEGQFDYGECLGYIIETIRRFKPQVVVTHDVNGEYGHGGHMYVSKLVRDALELTNDQSSYPESVQMYGTWDVPKTYLHLYAENPIEMKTRVPLPDLGGRTALQVAKDAYLKHVSQQWMWFYVDDGYDENGEPNDYQFSCARYGLYRTLVGADISGDDMLDNIKTYDEQEKEKNETEPVSKADKPEPEKEKKNGSSVWLIIVIILVLAIVIILIMLLLAAASRKRDRRRKQEMARRRGRR